MTIPAGSIIDAMDDPAVFGPWFTGPSWTAWRAILKGAFALPMDEAERATFRALAEREPPARRVRELWIIAGRRAGKDSVASLIAGWAAAYGSWEAFLRPGERALVMCLACDRDQAKIVLNYTRAYFETVPLLRPMVSRETGTGLELANSTEIAVATNNFRAVRGRAIALAIFDECAFWRDEASANPDAEVYRAILPGLATLPDAMLIGISSPYWQRGLLFEKFKRHYGKDGDVLVIKAPSIALNPTLDQAMIDRALAEDPEAAGAEWLANFRRDIASFVDRAVVDAAVVRGRHELPPQSGVTYSAFVDPSGGSADSMTLAIAHEDRERGILDCLRERRPPFSPDEVVREFVGVLKAYGVDRVTGDSYAGEWPRERFRLYGITYDTSPRPKSGIYLESMPALNAVQFELLDNQRLVNQLLGLERRTARGGRDSIDHAPGGHDDLANAALGALLLARGGGGRGVWFSSVEVIPGAAAQARADEFRREMALRAEILARHPAP